VTVARATDATWINHVLNDPIVRPWVADVGDGVLDVAPIVADRRNVILEGDHGVIAFLWLQAGVYECHTQILPSGRGSWATEFARECLRFMFTRTDAYEVATRIPECHLAARALATRAGLSLEFSRNDGCVFRGRRQRVNVYSLRIQDWMADDPCLEARGAWLHDRMAIEAERFGITDETHDDDINHNRYVGAAVEMAMGGQVAKGAALYNRWVSLARHTRGGKLQHVELVSVEPPVIRFDIGLMRFHADDIEVLPP
jgi:hypothetical protein